MNGPLEQHDLVQGEDDHAMTAVYDQHPERMRAIIATAWGGADLLAEAEVDPPAPGPT